MTTIYVTRSEQMAAQVLVERAARFGRPIKPWITKVANARTIRTNDVPVRPVATA